VSRGLNIVKLAATDCLETVTVSFTESGLGAVAEP
jgi:hypothetical protein